MYHAEIEWIDKDRAKELLAHNYSDNRKLRRSYVNQLSDVMSRGLFQSENGQTIVVGDDDGILYDGQHRLEAIVKSDTCYNFIVAYIVDGKDRYKTIDQGTKRTAADFINLPNKNDCASLSRVMACVEWGSAPLASCMQGRWNTNTIIDAGTQVLYCEQNADLVVSSVRAARNMRNAVSKGSTVPFSLFIALSRYLNEDILIDEFIDDFIADVPSNKTVAACRNSIMRVHMNKSASNVDRKWVLGILIDAYVHYTAMDDSVMLNKQSMRLEQYSKKIVLRREELGKK